MDKNKKINLLIGLAFFINLLINIYIISNTESLDLTKPIPSNLGILTMLITLNISLLLVLLIKNKSAKMQKSKKSSL